MSAIVDQPPLIATSRRPAWDIVIEYVNDRRADNAYGKTGIIDRVLTDMRDRDQVGRDRYGTPLTSGNGRDHLVDAYQEMLDAAVYFASALDERGVGPSTILDEDRIPDHSRRWDLFCVQSLFVDQVRSLIRLRALIEERPS
jgi:hypothetical protein